MFVGRREDAGPAAELWRYTPKAWDSYVEDPDPRDSLASAEREVEIDQVLRKWTIGEDPEIHVAAICKLVDGGVTDVLVHSAQAAQERVIDFYARAVLPRI